MSSIVKLYNTSFKYEVLDKSVNKIERGTISFDFEGTSKAAEEEAYKWLESRGFEVKELKPMIKEL